MARLCICTMAGSLNAIMKRRGLMRAHGRGTYLRHEAEASTAMYANMSEMTSSDLFEKGKTIWGSSIIVVIIRYLYTHAISLSKYDQVPLALHLCGAQNID